MIRMLLSVVAVTGLCVGGLRADDTKKPAQKTDTQKSDARKKDQKNEATITKVDPKAGTVVVRMKGENGKEQERTFHLTGDVRYFDSTGRVAALDVFRSGDYVLVVEGEGRLKEIHKKDQPADREHKDTGIKKDTNKKTGGH